MRYVVTVTDTYIVEIDESEINDPENEYVDIEDIIHEKIDNGDCEWKDGSFDVC